MGKTLRFQGHSDDTFGEYELTNDDYDNCASGKPIRWLVSSEADGLAVVVVGQHCPSGCGGWMIGVAPQEEGKMPGDWDIRIEYEHEYSPALVIYSAPVDVQLRCLELQE